VTITDASGQSAKVSVTVTVTTIGIN